MEMCKRSAKCQTAKLHTIRYQAADLATPVLGKHIKLIVVQWILDAIHDEMDPHQFKSLRRLSTTHALVDTLHHWHEEIHDRKSVQILFLDL